MDGARYRVYIAKDPFRNLLGRQTRLEQPCLRLNLGTLAMSVSNKARPTPTASAAPDEYLSFTPIPEQDSSEPNHKHSYIAWLWYVGYTKPNV